MQPSESERGQRWLSNFNNVDQPAARLLIDSLELVSESRFRSGLQKLIEKLPSKIETPIGLVPVRELGTSRGYFSLANRDAKPQLLLSNSFPGSEAIVANIASSIRRGAGKSGPFVASPSLRNLRLAKARTILYVDDFSGSGNRIVTFHKKFCFHPTIRSWRSYKLIDFHIAAYSMTREAYDILTRTFGKKNVHTVNICQTFDGQPWQFDQGLQIEAICKKYSRNPEFSLGFNNSKALTAFAHTAPNNLPAILWQARSTGLPWHSFFRERPCQWTSSSCSTLQVAQRN